MSDKLPIGIVGLNFGRHILAQIDDGAATPHVELAAVCDLDPDKVAKYTEQYNVPGYGDLDELLARDDIPAIGLFTGPKGRAALLDRIISAGKDVITTKPFEADPEAALAVLCKANELGRVLHINSPTPRFSADLQQIVDWQREYDLGQVVGCRADVWVRYHEKPDGNWYDDPKLCPIAPVYRLGIYLINDLVRLIGEPVSVQAMQSRIFTGRPTADNGQLGIRFANGALANIYASFCVNDGDYYRNSLTLNFAEGTIYRNVGAERANPKRGDYSELGLVMSDDSNGSFSQRCLVASTEVNGSSGHYQWDNFVKAVRGEDLGDTVTPEQVVASLRVVQAMSEAVETGRTIDLK